MSVERISRREAFRVIAGYALACSGVVTVLLEVARLGEKERKNKELSEQSLETPPTDPAEDLKELGITTAGVIATFSGAVMIIGGSADPAAQSENPNNSP